MLWKYVISFQVFEVYEHVDPVPLKEGNDWPRLIIKIWSFQNTEGLHDKT